MKTSENWCGCPFLYFFTGTNFARFINERNVIDIVTELDNASKDIAGNGNGKIVMFDLAIKMILLLKR